MSLIEYNKYRRKSKKIAVGNIFIGGDAPIAVQSMTNKPADDIVAVVKQALTLEHSGCDIVRITVPDLAAVATIPALKEAGITVPIVADIHYDYKIALECVAVGVDKIRINPGNIGDDSRIKEVAKACMKRNIPIRIGVNSGSLERRIIAKYGSPTAEALAESALYHVGLLERYDFNSIIIAIKSSSAREMIRANRILAEKTQYPLHLGVTEAGTPDMGILKSAAGIGALLCDGIGDTLRISLTADPVEEVKSARNLLKSLGVESKPSLNIISCPTCGRTKIDLIALVSELEQRCVNIELDKALTVAVMGCAVNGPGEAREADIGIAGGIGEAVLFRHGEILRKIDESEIIDTLISEIIKIKES